MATRIVEWQKPYSWGTAIEIDSDKVISLLLREENNLIHLNDDNEIYTDLQLEANIQPTDDFPVGVTVGRVLQADGWTQSGLLLNWKTTSWDYARWIYANDGKIYFDNWLGTWKQVYYSTEVDSLLNVLRTNIENTLVNDYQRKLTAGANITIDPTTNVISSTGGWWGWGSGDVVWPAGAVGDDIALFNWTSGKIIKDSWVMLSDLQEKLIAGTNISIAADWKTISATGGGSGDVTWPWSSTSGNLAVFDGVTGKVIKDWGAVPTVNNWTIKIKQSALVKGSFTLNQSTAEQTISLDAGFVPTNSATEGQVIMAATQGIGYYWASLGTAAAKDTGTSSWNVPVLDNNGKLATSTLPWVALTDTFTVSTSSDLTNLTSAEQGDLAIVTTESKTYVLSADPYSTAANWKEILSPTGWVTSVNWNTWAVTVTEFTPTSAGSTGDVLKKTSWGYDWSSSSEFTPTSAGSTGQVLTKTAWGYDWAAPSVQISSDANNILSSGAKLWAGSASDYENLGTYSNDTIYLTVE